ncbi:MAG: tol-pal system protein YbgF [Thermodesulfobacteriota bacterium]|nr:tol-pal system protein YbgF [Thermodesulfobacteriota bacterium]
MFTASTFITGRSVAGRFVAVFTVAMLLGLCGCAGMAPRQATDNGEIEEINKKLDTIYHRLSVIQFMLDDHERILRSMKTDAAESTVPPATETTETMAATEEMPQAMESEPLAPAPPSPETLYHEAIEKFRDNQYDDALALFQQFAETFPDHDLADNALYWAGECLYSQKNYEGSIPIFKELIQNYPEGNKKPDALLKTGYAYISLNDTVNAEIYLKNVIRNYPFSDAAEKAKKKLGTLE